MLLPWQGDKGSAEVSCTSPGGRPDAGCIAHKKMRRGIHTISMPHSEQHHPCSASYLHPEVGGGRQHCHVFASVAIIIALQKELQGRSQLPNQAGFGAGLNSERGGARFGAGEA